MYGQMTAGSWIYIGSQGILQGTYETLAEVGAPAFRRHAVRTAGRHRRPRRHGRRPAARRDDERRAPRSSSKSIRSASRAASRPAISTRPPTASTRRSTAVGRWTRERRRALDRRCAATPPTSCRRWSRAASRPTSLTDQTSAHDALERLRAERAVARRGEPPARARSGGLRRALDGGDGRPRARDARAARRAARSPSTTATTSAPRRRQAGVADAFDIPGFVPEYIRPLFCEGKGPFRWVALSGDPEDIRVTDRGRARDVSARRGAGALDSPGRASGSRSRDCRRASAGSATASAPGSDCASTSWCATAGSRRRS